MRNNLFSSFILSLFTAALPLSADSKSEENLSRQAAAYQVEDPLTQLSLHTRTRLAKLSHENAQVLNNFDLLSRELEYVFRKEKSLKQQEVQAIYSAIEFAAEKHRLQMRQDKEKTPYISHPLGVTYHLIHEGGVREPSVIIASLLHDAVNEAHVTFDEIEKKFGKVVSSYVHEVTEDMSLPSGERKRLQIIEAIRKSPGATQIELADKLCNLHELLDHPPEEWSRLRIDRYFQWAQSIMDRLPQANEKLKAEMQRVINSYWEKQKSLSSEEKLAKN